MVPDHLHRSSRAGAAPRACGDGPATFADVAGMTFCSPRLRGWSLRTVSPTSVGSLLPAPAGMVPLRGLGGVRRRPAPRACGDGPRCSRFGAIRLCCSPRLRGWSRAHRHRHRRQPLLPAPAGMVPRSASGRSTCCPAPRACGDGPEPTTSTRSGSSCSPRLRGWSRLVRGPPAGVVLLPAPAGMVPWATRSTIWSPAAPRARGDGPITGLTLQGSSFCSPRPRGWSLLGQLQAVCTSLLPAPAGMVPPGGWRSRTS